MKCIRETLNTSSSTAGDCTPSGLRLPPRCLLIVRATGPRTAPGRCTWSSSASTRSTDPARSWRVYRERGRRTTLLWERILRRTTRQPQRTDSKLSSWCSKGRGGGRLSDRENKRLTELGEVKVMTVRGGWKDDDVEKPASGKEEVVRKVKRRYRLRTRLLASFFGHSARCVGTRSATSTERTRLSFLR